MGYVSQFVCFFGMVWYGELPVVTRLDTSIPYINHPKCILRCIYQYPLALSPTSYSGGKIGLVNFSPTGDANLSICT